MSGTSRVELGHRSVRQDRLAARPRVPADEPFDVDRGTRDEPLERLDESGVVDPLLDAELLLEYRLVEPAGALGDHRLLGSRDRARAVGEPVDVGLAVLGDEGVERLHEVPGRAVDPRLVTRVNVPLRTAPPLFAGRDPLELDDTFCTERDLHDAVGAVGRRGHEDARRFRERRLNLRPPHDLREVGRADLLLPFRDEHEVDGELATGPPEGVQRREERRFGSLLVDRAPSDDDSSEARLVDDSRLPRRRRPLRGIDLLHVVHEIHAGRPAGAGVERREHAGLPVGRDLHGGAEARVAQEPDHQVAPLRHAVVLGGNRRLMDPLLQPFDRLVVPLLDLGEDGREIRGLLPCALRQRENRRGSSHGFQKTSSVHGRRVYSRQQKLRADS
jgi:hypothetical protein